MFVLMLEGNRVTQLNWHMKVFFVNNDFVGQETEKQVLCRQIEKPEGNLHMNIISVMFLLPLTLYEPEVKYKTWWKFVCAHDFHITAFPLHWVFPDLGNYFYHKCRKT